jgi:hypothetical protein
LVSELIKEAESAAGTWSLATYRALRVRATGFSPTDRRLLISEIFTRMFDASDKPSTCYKLAQILSAIHVMNFPEFEGVVRCYEEPLDRICRQLNQATMLGRPTLKLVQSLLHDHANIGGTWHGCFQVRRLSCNGPGPDTRAQFAPGPRPKTR